MLRELRNVQKVSGEAKRRWFFCHDLDLVVWEDDNGVVCGFQLTYDEHKDEHSISWHRDSCYSHYVVDDGEPMPGVNDTPFLYADGPFRRDQVLNQFPALSSGVPADIVAFVTDRLREFNGPLVP